MLVPGKYRIIQLASICGVSRTTAEKFIERYTLTETLVPYNGREVAGVQLSEVDIETIARDYPRVLEEEAEEVSKGNDTPVLPREVDNNTLLEELRDRINVIEVEKTQLINELSDKRVEIAVLQGDIKRQEDLIEQLNQRLKDKDQVIESIKSEAEAQKSRADSFNNQIRGLNDKLQTTRGANSNEDMERWMQAAYEKQKHEISQMLAQKLQIEVNEAQKVKEKKGFRLFGLEISRASNRWEGALPRQRSTSNHRRPHYYQ